MAKEIMGINSSVLRELKNIFKETNIEEVELEEEEKFYLKISRKKEQVQYVAAPAMQAAPAPTASAPAQQQGSAGAPEASVPAADKYADESKYHKITSPVIGTYYESSSPGSDPFVKTGDTVSPDSTVCIVEAMKVMNEIKADVKGRIVESLKSNEDPVQSGEVIFIVEKL